LILSKVIDTRFISAVSVHRATYCDVVVPHWAVLCGIVVMVVQAATFALKCNIYPSIPSARLFPLRDVSGI